MIAIIYTTFLRDELMIKTTESIVNHFPSNSILLIADQGYKNSAKDNYYTSLQSKIPCEVHYLDFDCGAYYARNRLVERAKELNCEFCLIMADSIGMIQDYDFQPIIEFLNEDKKRALVGFELNGSKCAWEYLMEVTPNGIQFSYSNQYITSKLIRYLRIDICRNIYLAKTDVLLDVPYDEDLKLGGHELNFLNLKKADYECYWTNRYIFQRYNSVTSEEYQQYRKRFSNFKTQAMNKLGIKGWVKMPKEIK